NAFSACRDSHYFYRKQAALNSHGSVRQTEGAKNRRPSTADPACVAICRTANTAGTPGGKTKRSRRATCHQKGRATPFKGAIAARTPRERLSAVAASLCEAHRLHRSGLQTSTHAAKSTLSALRVPHLILPLRP